MYKEEKFMKYASVLIVILSLNLLLFNGCQINIIEAETNDGNLENMIITNTEEAGTVYPQAWATGDGTASNPWAGDCINKALDAVPDGGTIYLRAGYYLLSHTLWSSTKSYNLIGEGRNKTIIVTSMTNKNGIYIDTDHCTLKGFTINGASQADNGPSLINVHSCDYTLLKDIEIENAGKMGINLYITSHSSLQNIYAHDNYTHGVHPHAYGVAGGNMYNTYRDIYCWSNGRNGFDDWGNNIKVEQYNVYDNLQCWDNGELGIAISNQKNGVLSNSFASGNGEKGIHLSRIEDFDITDCLVTDNAGTGITLCTSKNINFTNVIVKNNKNGISIQNCSNATLITCQSFDDRFPLLQIYGLELKAGCSGITVSGCKLTPNRFGDIYNPNNLAVKVIGYLMDVSLMKIVRE